MSTEDTMFFKPKRKLVRDYSILTSILLFCVSLAVFCVGIYMSYKEQVYQINMLAIEEGEELYYHLHDATRETASNLDIPNANEDSYFNKIFVYGYDTKHDLILQHNNMSWSEPIMQKLMQDDTLMYNDTIFNFELIGYIHPKALIIMRYPLMKDQEILGEVYVGMEITYWFREQVRILFIIVLITMISLFFVRFVAYKMANKAMVPVAQSFKQQKQFISDASHELRTPLSIIISGMTVLTSDEDNKLSPFSQSVVADIHDETLRMKKLIDDLLVTARYDNNTLKINPSSFNLKELLDKLYTKFSLLATQKDITLTLKAPEKLMVYADINQIEQILGILIDNAIKYTREQGEVNIEVTKQKSAWHIAIRDNGIGISDEDLPHIFERFYRADKSRTHYGNGLGLSIAQMLAAKNHSKIVVTSSENKGSCFTLIMHKV